AAASWDWRGQQLSFVGLPPPALLGRVQFDNAATVLAAVECLHSRLPLNRAAIERGLRSVRLAGRFQIARRDADRGVDWILDVAHNPAAAQTLAANLAAREHRGRTIAVCGILADKDIGGVIAALRESIDIWIVAGVDGPRALSAQGLADAVRQAGVEVTHTASDVRYACEFARGTARSGDRIVVFGSFHTVGPALEWLTASDV
ncbi:MAG: bifunctional folylpolyglutamate synthase/dihydrofolate synthase, partial [Candidatus Obscuribacterales bacterium]|nr:bifunctional folylpolyglutamate synthase/dihydrofolate synthase [Steroidobacteraceae bacterium]